VAYRPEPEIGEKMADTPWGNVPGLVENAWAAFRFVSMFTTG
jgi:hypothetical protein